MLHSCNKSLILFWTQYSAFNTSHSLHTQVFHWFVLKNIEELSFGHQNVLKGTIRYTFLSYLPLKWQHQDDIICFFLVLCLFDIHRFQNRQGQDLLFWNKHYFSDMVGKFGLKDRTTLQLCLDYFIPEVPFIRSRGMSRKEF